MSDRKYFSVDTIKTFLIISLLCLIFALQSHAKSLNKGTILFHIFENDSSFQINRINADGTGLKKIINNGFFPVFNPTGEMFAYLTFLAKRDESEKKKVVVAISDIKGHMLHTIRPLRPENTRVYRQN